ncbi:MAG: hypothetical protein M1401_11380 [Chloroflexi bacterium]|nr:hypothetical protein [Chloroflexota bacterium]MCL5109448.1 hypothetical protein [Chloroflexota bacterium]
MGGGKAKKSARKAGKPVQSAGKAARKLGASIRFVRRGADKAGEDAG